MRVVEVYVVESLGSDGFSQSCRSIKISNLWRMFLRHLICFRKFSLKYGRISKGVLQRSSTINPPKTSPLVSSSLSTNYYAFSIPFRTAYRYYRSNFAMSSSLLIQISSLRRNNSVFISVI